MNIIHAYIKIKPEYREEFLEKVRDLVKNSQAEEGNISYKLYEETTEQNAFVMLEEWKDKAAIEYHFQTPHFTEWGKISKDFYSEPTKVLQFEATPLA
ncbi:putative quinol monooxygenase [Litchfieldia alkalitelluris]|uniref:putative quinol monooxygenase n=1 Tax=Litchfieldia alkalitelluris TaxID=304268 RepID=UPI00099830A5|nr:putative quinol monooxygenase [Litchfieldia alkalitelluris]